MDLQMTVKPKKGVEKASLPEGERDFTPSERNLAVEHTIKMVRDGSLAGILSTLHLSAAIYNWSEFELYKEKGHKFFKESVEDEFGYSERQAKKYLKIGDHLATALGGGFISQRMISVRIHEELFSGKLGVNKLTDLTKVLNGMTALLEAKTPEDVTRLLETLERNGKELEDQKSVLEGRGKKAVRLRKFTEQNPAGKDELYHLLNGVKNGLKKLSAGDLKKLREACRSIPREAREQYRSTKLCNAAQSVWNEVFGVLTSLQCDLAPLHVDTVSHAERVQRQLTNNDEFVQLDAYVEKQPVPEMNLGEDEETDPLKAVGIESSLLGGDEDNY